MEFTLRHRGGEVTLSVQRLPDGSHGVTVDGAQHRVEAELLDSSTLRLIVEGTSRVARIARIGREYHVALDGEVHVFSMESGGAGAGHGQTLASPQILAPMPGKVLQVLVEPGQEVAAGDGLLILEAMKMENRIIAEAAAIVLEVHVSAGDMVDGGTVMLELEYRSGAE